MTQSISATRVATLAGRFDRSPAYSGLADALTVAIGDGRIGYDVRLPSERDLTAILGVSRTTVSRAYEVLRDTGYAHSRQGAGTFTRLPGGPLRRRDRALAPGAPEGTIDLNCAAATAPPGLVRAYAEAVADLPPYLGGHGYYPAGLPQLQAAIAATYEARGLPTDPVQIVVTPGALSAAAIVAQAMAGPGAHVLVESPVYPNATQAIKCAGAWLHPSHVDPSGWDVAAIAATLRQVRPSLSYLIPDFQNPTGHLMTAEQREALAGALRATGTVAIVDEAHQALALDGQPMPPPFATFAPDAITLGSAAKAFWGGLRLGWIRAPHRDLDRITQARLALDLGSPVLEQLVLARLLEQGPVLPEHVERLRVQRHALLTALSELVPEFQFYAPGGGLSVWCQLPSAHGSALADEAERHGLAITPGPVFAVEGGLDRFVRIPWTRPADELTLAVERLAQAWEVVRSARVGAGGRRDRVTVA